MSVGNGERRLALDGCGQVDPTSIDSYQERGGYSALLRAILEAEPADVLSEIEKSGLRGRGGAGYPTAEKWRKVAQSEAETRYVVANAYDADPTSPIGRTLLEQNPHRVIEGVLLAAYAIGAADAFIYTTGGKSVASERLARAIEQARQAGLIGRRIAQTRFSCEVTIARAWGGFIAGEETAALAAIEGRRATPEQKPPYPAEWGLLGKPTLVNSAETLASLPWILANGSAAFVGLGPEKAHGTKVVGLGGHLSHPGMVEVELGTSIRTLIGLGGGARDGAPLRAIQVGGPTGGFLPESLWDTPLEYGALAEVGAIMGSGSVVAVEQAACMVDRARASLTYLAGEACGKCVPCRLGTKRMAGLLEGIASGLGRAEDLALLEELSVTVSDGSLCGFGITAPNPLLTSLRYFREDYMAHIEEGRCPAGRCQPLRSRRYEKREVL